MRGAAIRCFCAVHSVVDRAATFLTGATRRPRRATVIGMRRKRPDEEPPPPKPAADRAWSARRNVSERDATTDLVSYTALPAETGPTWAPDELSIWPVEGGRYGLDAHYHGPTGLQRADHQLTRLARVNLSASVRRNDSGGATLRLGPLAHEAAWLALEAFLGRPLRADP
jgi:hypothetical protein